MTNTSECVRLEIPPSLTGGEFLVSDRRFLNKGYASLNCAVTKRSLAENDPLILTLLQHSGKQTLESEVQRATFTPRTGTLGRRGVIVLSLLLLSFGTVRKSKTKWNKPNSISFFASETGQLACWAEF